MYIDAVCTHAMRRVHAEGLRERQRMKDSSSGRSLVGTTFSYRCRICGVDHGTDRHTDCPVCGHKPRDFYSGPWGPDGVHASDSYSFPFRTDTSWASKRVKALD